MIALAAWNAANAHARQFCDACPVRLACLRWALDVEGDGISVRGRYGIYGGLTPDERAQLTRKARR
jgi:hypothetical protein